MPLLAKRRYRAIHYVVYAYTNPLPQIELEESVSTLTEHLEKHQDELSKKDGQIVQLSTQLKHFQDVSPP